MSLNVFEGRFGGKLIIIKIICYIQCIIIITIIQFLCTLLFSKFFTHISFNPQNNGTIGMPILEMNKLDIQN